MTLTISTMWGELESLCTVGNILYTLLDPRSLYFRLGANM